MRPLLPALLVCAFGLVHCKRTPPQEHAPPVVVPPAVPALPPALVLQAPPAATSSSSLALGRVGEHVYAAVTDEDANALHLIDVERAVVVATLALPAKPGHVVVHGTGLAVALRETTEVRTVSLRGTEAAPELALDEAAIPAPFDPLALYSDGAHLMIASASSATLSRDGVLTPLPRDPRAVLLAKDGAAEVSHATGSTLSTVTTAGAHTELSLDLGETCTEDAMVECMTTVVPPSLQTYALARYEDAILVPSVSSLTDGPFPILTSTPPQSAGHRLDALDFDNNEPSFGGYGGGNVSTPITFRIDVVRAGKKADTLELTGSRIGAHECTLPRGLAVDEASHQVWLACLGDAKIIRHEVQRTKKGLVLKQKQQLEVPFVTSLAYDAPNARLLAYSPFERTVTVLAGEAKTQITLPKVEQKDDRAAGRRLFFSTDKRISAGKKACASCHPDGGDDGLAWNTTQGKRRTLGLAGRVPETKVGWEGKHATLEVHVAQTIKQNLRGKGLDATEIAALLTYVRSMKAPASRPLEGAAARGKTVFSGAADCSTCHDPANRFSDGLVHDVGGGSFRTPSLIGISGRGRLFHDGRFHSLDELFTGTSGRMGLTAALSAEDRSALQSYLATL